MAEAKHLLFITIDCMRADYLRNDITPVVCRLAKKGTVYTSAYANGCGTPDSFPAIFASRFARPFAHADGFDADTGYALQPGDVTLAESLESAGYETVGFVGGNPYLGRRYGYNRGFSTYKDHQPASLVDQITGTRLRGAMRKMAHRLPWSPYPSAQQVTSATLTWLAERRQRQQNQPFFMWIHYMDAHFPTIPPGHSSLREKLAAWSPIKGGAEKHHGLLVNLYESAIRYIDTQLGCLLDAMTPETTVVVTADHGQLFGEHDSYWHNGVWEQLLRVPLVLAGPGVEAGEVDDIVQLLDLSPHLLKLLDVESPQSWVGNELRPPKDSIYAVSNNPSGRTYTEALISPGLKIVRTPDLELQYERTGEPADMVLS